jgi:MoxR-like ATPase
MATVKDWKIYRGGRKPHGGIDRLPDPPPWRPTRAKVRHERTWPLKPADDSDLPPAVIARGSSFHATPHIVEMVNAALYLRRPLLLTGAPGSGKSSLVDAVAYELRLGAPLRWPVTSRSTLRDALYQYDAISRLQQKERGEAVKESSEERNRNIGEAITLGALGTALLPTDRPRALLIDEIDKSDVDLPNDLLNVFEEGEFEIPELRRLGSDAEVEVFTSDPAQKRAWVTGGVVACKQFPLMLLTSNGEREFPAPFLRRCLRLRMPNPTGQLDEDDNKEWKRLDAIIELHFKDQERAAARDIVDAFKATAGKGASVATDQLLNAIYFVMSSQLKTGKEREAVVQALTRELTDPGA